MELMEEDAAYDILVISDSDVRVTPDYLRAVALPFADARVGAITCPYRGVAAEGGLWARLEAVGMSVEMTAGVLAARLMEDMQFTLGPTMAFRRETIRRMGGFRVTADYCADDFVLGNETFKLGQKVVLSHHAIDHMVINASLVQSLKHQVRWMKSTRFSRPKGHFGTALTFSMPFGLLGLAARRSLRITWRSALASCCGRCYAAGAFDRGGQLGGARPELVRSAGAISHSRPDGLLLLGGELFLQPHSVARARVPTAARRQDAGREITSVTPASRSGASPIPGPVPERKKGESDTMFEDIQRKRAASFSLRATRLLNSVLPTSRRSICCSALA